MIKIRQAVIVEGRYDKIKLASMLDALIIEVGGFGIFKDKEKLELIRALAETRGLVILTDSDSAGFMIRSYIGGSVRQGQVIHAYIPDILGRERRKSKPGAEGKLGVEGVPAKVLMQTLERAGVTVAQNEPPRRKVTVYDLFEAGLSGRPGSAEKRSRLLKKLELPARLSAGSMLDVINSMMTFEEFLEKADHL